MKETAAQRTGKGIQSWFFRNRKPILIGSMISCILFLLLFVFLWIEYRAAIGEGLLLAVSASAESLVVNTGESKEVTFQVNGTTAFFCRANCSYTFEDISSGTLIDFDSFIFSGTANTQKSYTLAAASVGSGQSLYTFKVSCTNVQKSLCRHNGKTSSRVTFITLNYDLSSEQKASKELLKERLELALRNFNKTDYALQRLNDKYVILAKDINLFDFIQAKNVVNQKATSLRLELEQFERLWYNESFFELANRFSNSTSVSNSALQLEIDELTGNLSRQLETHNTYVEISNRFALAIPPLGEFAATYKDNELLESFKSYIGIVSGIQSALEAYGNQNYTFVIRELGHARSKADALNLTTYTSYNKLRAQSGFLL